MLNLLHLKQTGVVESPEQYQVSVTTEGDFPECYCLLPKVVKNGTKEVLFMDTPMHGKKVGILVARQRFLCQGCKSTLYPDVPHMHEKHQMTQRLVAYIQKYGTERTFAALANEIGITSQTVSDIWNAYAREQLAKLAPVTPEWMGIDELFIMKGYRCVITNVKERTLVDMLPDRKKLTIVSYFAGMEDAEKVKVVTMDMWDDYREAVKIALPKAKIVVDRFHVMQHASAAVELARKRVRAQLKGKLRLSLMGDRFLFLKARENLSVEETIILQAVLEQYPTIKMAYGFKESFRDVWACKTLDEAKTRYDDWKAQVEASEVAPAYSALLKAMTNWREEIFGYFEWKLTNAYTESFNSLARRMDRMGRGYSFPVLRAKLLLMHSCHKRGAPVPFSRSSTPGAAAFMRQGPFLGLDLSTLADEVGKLPETE